MDFEPDFSVEPPILRNEVIPPPPKKKPPKGIKKQKMPIKRMKDAPITFSDFHMPSGASSPTADQQDTYMFYTFFFPWIQGQFKKLPTDTDVVGWDRIVDKCCSLCGMVDAAAAAEAVFLHLTKLVSLASVVVHAKYPFIPACPGLYQNCETNIGDYRNDLRELLALHKFLRRFVSSPGLRIIYRLAKAYNDSTSSSWSI